MSDHVQSVEPYIMKSYKVLFLALIVAAAFALSAQAGDRHGNNDNSQRGPARGRGSAPTMHSSSGFRSGGNRMFARPSGMTMRSMQQFSQRRMIGGENTSFVPRQFTPRTFSSGGNNNGVARFENNRRTQTNRFAELQGQRGNRLAQSGTGGGNRTVGNISPGHNHVFAQRSGDWNRNWDRSRRGCRRSGAIGQSTLLPWTNRRRPRTGNASCHRPLSERQGSGAERKSDRRNAAIARLATTHGAVLKPQGYIAATLDRYIAP